MKKIYLFIITVFVLTSCQKDEIAPPSEENAVTSKDLQEINFSDLPDDVLSNFDNKKFVYYKGTKSKNMFGPARTDVPAVKSINKKGRVSYTIALKKVDEYKSADSLYFDNLYIQETEEGVQRMCVIRYKPEESWYNQKKQRFERL